MLASRGVDPTLSEDIVQEVAVRALDKQVPFTDSADLYRWAATTARHLHIDHVRIDARTTGDEALLGVADGTDVAHMAERRVALGQVWRALAVMRPRERDAILESLEDRAAHSSQALVRRHRARASLRKAVGGVLTAAMVARLRLREVAPALRTASATATLAPVLAIGAGGLIGDTPDTVRRPLPYAAAPAATAPERPLPRLAKPVGAASTRRSVAKAAERPVAPARAALTGPADEAQSPDHDGRVPGTPLVVDDTPENPPKDSKLCLENYQKPIWCVPDLDNPPAPVEV